MIVANLHTTAGKAAAIVLGICVAGGATFFGVSQVMEARQEAKEAEVQEEIERQEEKEKKRRTGEGTKRSKRLRLFFFDRRKFDKRRTGVCTELWTGRDSGRGI